MEFPLLQPGEYATRTRLSPKALRLYAEQGLLVPAYVDRQTGYRYYASSQLERGRLIGLLRRAGMPLDRVGAVMDLNDSVLAAAIRSWWASVEDDMRVRRELVHYLDRYLTQGQDPMYDVSLRDIPERKLLTVERRVTVDGLEGFISAATSAIVEQLKAGGIAGSGQLRVIYHGMVTQDSDGPVEVAVPFTGTVEPAGELRIRMQAAGTEAYTRLRAAEAEYPGILAAYDAVGHWIDQNGMGRAGSPVEVYVLDRQAGAPEPAGHVDVAWPVTGAGA